MSAKNFSKIPFVSIVTKKKEYARSFNDVPPVESSGTLISKEKMKETNTSAMKDFAKSARSFTPKTGGVS
jgi:hypothetical protein